MHVKDIIEVLGAVAVLIYQLVVVVFYTRAARLEGRLDPVRLKVRSVSTISWDGAQRLSIEVVNVGDVPVTVEQVGFKLRDQANAIAYSPVPPGDILPQSLNPEASLTLIAPAGMENDPAMKEMFCAFVRTSMGSEFTSLGSDQQRAFDAARAAAVRIAAPIGRQIGEE